MIKVAIAGGSGLVGKYIASVLIKNNIVPIILTRKTSAVKDNIQYVHWNAYTNEIDAQYLSDIKAVINLSGAGIADKKWTESRKAELYNSRIQTTKFLIQVIKKFAPHCTTFINASAIGIYGADKNNATVFKEEDITSSTGFIEQLCKDWEAEALKASDSFRVVIMRIGIVLGKNGGAFLKFYNPLKMGIMPILGNGNQIMSWIHIKDLAEQFLFALQNEKIEGAYNCVAPHPISNKALMKTLANVKGGLAIPIPVPAFALKITMGKMANEILKSTNVSAGKIINEGFVYQFPKIEDAVKNLTQA